MAFTYDLTTTRGKARLNLGDTVQNSGPRPDRRNFSDDEIDHLLTTESSVINAATAFGFELLASEWAAYSLKDKEGDTEYDAKGLAETYSELAAKWRAKPGGGDSGGTLQAGVIALDFMQKGDSTNE